MLNCFSRVRPYVTPWTAAHQAPLSMKILQARTLERVARPPPDSGVKLLESSFFPFLLPSFFPFFFPSPLPPQSGTHSSCGCQVGQAHMLLAGQAPPGAGGAGRQLRGLCSEWLLSPVLCTCQIQLICRDSWLPLQMHPAGDGEMDAFPTQKAFSPGISFS